jgi:hypothetical protein
MTAGLDPLTPENLRTGASVLPALVARYDSLAQAWAHSEARPPRTMEVCR